MNSTDSAPTPDPGEEEREAQVTDLNGGVGPDGEDLATRSDSTSAGSGDASAPSDTAEELFDGEQIADVPDSIDGADGGNE